jgi:cysteinyl-tRNA synthetase
MTLRFFVLQAHYRGTLDFSNQALESSEKGLERLMIAYNTLNKIKPGPESGFDLDKWKNKCFDALNDDLNTPILIAQLFDAVKQINLMENGSLQLTANDLKDLKFHFQLFVKDILGLKSERGEGISDENKEQERTVKLIKILINMRTEAKNAKNFDLSDQIRIQLNEMGIIIKDTKEGTEYSIK